MQVYLLMRNCAAKIAQLKAQIDIAKVKALLIENMIAKHKSILKNLSESESTIS